MQLLTYLCCYDKESSLLKSYTLIPRFSRGLDCKTSSEIKKFANNRQPKPPPLPPKKILLLFSYCIFCCKNIVIRGACYFPLISSNTMLHGSKTCVEFQIIWIFLFIEKSEYYILPLGRPPEFA